VCRQFKIDKKIESMWLEKLKQGLIMANTDADLSPIPPGEHILKPGKISDPISVLKASFLFLFGPIPFVENLGLAGSIASFEAPLWWILYLYIGLQFYRSRKTAYIRNPLVLLTLCFSMLFVVFSAMVEVNLGTSFRHRAVLIVPIIILSLQLEKYQSPSINKSRIQ
jgi:hypothetical protein